LTDREGGETLWQEKDVKISLTPSNSSRSGKPTAREIKKLTIEPLEDG